MHSPIYKKVRPFGPGWGSIAEEAGSAPEGATDGQSIPAGLLGWSAGCTVIWSSLFMVGNLLYGRTGAAVGLLVVFVLSGLVLIRSVRRLWN